jgi:long-chain acyl-CoA synthetase
MLSALLEKNSINMPEKTGLIVDHEQYSFQQLFKYSQQLATLMSKLGIKKGDRVAFFLPNSLEIVLCYYACFRIGAISVPLNIHFNDSLLEYVIDHSEASLLITHDVLFPQLKAQGKLKSIRHIIITGDQSIEHTIPFKSIYAEEPNSIYAGVSEDSPAAIFYTSGTTGKPKGVVHTYGGLKQAALMQIKQIGITSNDVTIILFPVCYLIGVGSQLLTHHLLGAMCLMLSSFKVKSAFDFIQKYRVTKLYGFPGLYNELINYKAATQSMLQSVDFCFSAGEAIAAALQHRFKEQFGQVITEGCGMSELQVYSMNPDPINKVGSIGKPICEVEMALIDAERNVITTPNQVGELIVKTPCMTQGYWRDTGETDQSIVNGWFYTGDLAYYDAEGFYWFFCRKSDLIIHKGHLISPLEIEATLYQHPAVKEAGVVSLAKVSPEETICAFVTLKGEEMISPEILINFVRTKLPDDKVPRQVTILEKMPLGLTGKIDRPSLRKGIPEESK